jgi:Protein of unknown function (DUF2975)
MSPETQEKLAKVKKYSASLSMVFWVFWFILAFAGLIGLIIVLTINDSQRVPSTLDFGGVTYVGDEITWSVKIAVSIGWALTVAISLKLLGHLGKLFGLYARGQIFTAENVGQIREIGISVFLFMAIWAYGLLTQYVIGVPGAGSAIEARGMAVRGFGFGLPEPLTVVLAGIIIVVVSWIMDVGRELREDQDLTV